MVLSHEIECLPLAQLPGSSLLFRAYAEDAEAVRGWYGAPPFGMGWAGRASELSEAARHDLSDALLRQTDKYDSPGAALANIERLKNGAAAVVTGQQVGLFGGPLLTLLKAATAIRKAQDATAASGREHVPVFWLASEDHDLAEVDQLDLLGKTTVERLSLGLDANPGGGRALPVGGRVLGDHGDEGHARLQQELERACELLGWAPICDMLRECYQPGATLAGAFGRLLTKVFAPWGLVVMDAATRDFHALGAPVLRAAIERAQELEEALLERSAELLAGGFHAQVLVERGHSLLFLIEEAETGPGQGVRPGARLALRRTAEGVWKAGSRTYSTAELLAVLEASPERLSPNALLRPVFQDAILPTAAYVGGPAEVAYFAQSQVVYELVLGRVTPVLPRLSATLISPAVGKVMDAHEVSLSDVWAARTADELAVRLGARAMAIEGKRKLAAAGNAMDAELTALTEYMSAMSAELGRAAEVSASKMRYQMNRLRRMAARFELQQQAALHKHAAAMVLNLLPGGHLQERVVGGVQFLAQAGESLPALLVDAAAQECPGHRVIRL